MDIIIGLLNDTCEIGETVVGEYRLTETEDVIATFKVISKATYEEWLAYRNSENRPIEHNLDFDVNYYTFYKVHTD